MRRTALSLPVFLRRRKLRSAQKIRRTTKSIEIGNTAGTKSKPRPRHAKCRFSQSHGIACVIWLAGESGLAFFVGKEQERRRPYRCVPYVVMVGKICQPNQNQRQKAKIMSSVYLGGSRHLQSPSPAIVQVVSHISQVSGSIHVGCCVGADAIVIQTALSLLPLSSLVVFAVSSASGAGGSALSSSLVPLAASKGVSVHWLAGGTLHIPLAARLISRSLAAAHGCSSAVFFSPGSGSLAVASHLAPSKPVFAFGSLPAPIPNQAGSWVESSLFSLACWQWSPAQLSF